MSSKTEKSRLEHPAVRDGRGGKIIFLSHCCLNQNAKVRGIAKYPAMIRPLVELLLERDVGIFQMPCPEMTSLGAMRWGQVKDQYNSPMFRRHCRELAGMVLDQAEEYLRGGYRVLGFVMMDGSPVCGLNWTPQPAAGSPMWGGMTRYVPEQTQIPDRGVFCEILQRELEERQLLTGIPFVAFPEPEVESVISFDRALRNFIKIL